MDRAVERLPHGKRENFRFILNVQGLEGLLFDCEVKSSVLGRYRCIMGVDGQRIAEVQDGIHATGSAILEAEDITEAGQVLIGNGDQSLLRPNGRRLIVVEFQPSLEGIRLPHLDMEKTLTADDTRPQLSVDALNAVVGLQKLQPLLQRIYFDRRAHPEGDAILEVAGQEPPVPLHFYVGQFSLDDLDCEDPLCDGLIRDERAGRHIALVDVVQGQGLAQGLQVFRGQLPVRIRRRDLGQLVGSKDSTAKHVDRSHKHPEAGQPFALFRRNHWRLKGGW